MSDESILLRLEALGKRAPRVLLRQDGSPGAPPIETCGRYEVLGALAQGGVGEVLRGRDLDLGRDVAIKVLRAGHVANAEMLQRFVDEAQIAGQLQHPGVVPVYELGLRADRRPYIAMKLVKGRTLAALLHEGSSDRRRHLRILGQVCRTVAYAHGRGVVHRDLKPSNIMVGAFGEVQVLDWGFAKVLSRGGVADERRPSDVTRIATARSGGGSESVAGSVMGTPAYMPPEQALGHVDQLDERSDVFSLGAILCEILTGKPPYTGDDLLAKAAEARLEDAHARLECCEDRDLAAIARRCLSPLRANRPREAGEVAEGVLGHLAAAEERAQAAAVAAAEAEAAADGARREAGQQRRARRQTRLVAAALVLAIVTGLGSYVAIAAEKRSQRERAAGSVAAALREAQDRRGAGDHRGAREAATRAAMLARAAGLAADRADETLATIAAEEQAANRDAEQRARADAFVAELDEMAVESGEGLGDDTANQARFREIFGRRGIDLDSPEAAAERIRRDWSGIRAQLAAALDERAWQHRAAERGMATGAWHGLVAIASGIDPDPWRDRLRATLAERDLAALRELRRESATRDDLHPRTLDLLALALDAAGDPDEAIAVLYAVWRSHPDDFLVILHLGAGLRLQGKLDESLRYYRAGLALRPGSACAWHEFAHLLADRGDLAGAERAFRKAWDLAPQALGHAGCLARQLRRQGDAARARELGQEIRERIAPDSLDAYHMLGLALANADDLDGAIEVFREAIRRWPDAPFVLLNLGNCLLQRGDNEDAVAAYRESVRQRPDHGVSRAYLGAALYSIGDLASAETAYREAIRLGWATADVHNNLATLLRAEGDTDGAISEIREALRLDGDHGKAHLNLGFALRFRDPKGSLASFRKAQDLGCDHPDLGSWIARAEQVAELEQRLPEILQGRAEPRDASERATCARLCMGRRQFAEAARLYAEVFSEDPMSADDRTEGDRYNAACAAAQAGSEEWRSRALEWLRADLASYDAWHAKNPRASRIGLERWKRDPDLAGVREVKGLPEAERAGWRRLWEDVDTRLAIVR